jgi:hypothetical protein
MRVEAAVVGTRECTHHSRDAVSEIFVMPSPRRTAQCKFPRPCGSTVAARDRLRFSLTIG